MFVFLASSLAAQIQQPLAAFQYGRGGVRLDSASFSTGYYSNGLNAGPIFLPPDLASRDIVMLSGSAVMGWSRTSERSHAGLTYSPNYMASAEGQRLRSWNHNLTFTGSRNISPKWNFGAGMNASYSTAEQLLFSQGTFSAAAALPASLEDFANNLLRRPFTPDQLAATLSGSQIADLPARQLLYGNRIFHSSASLSLSYLHSTRTTVTWNASANRTQPLDVDSGGVRADLIYTGLLRHTTSGTTAITVSHTLTPRTEMGITAEASRVYSPLMDTYRTVGSGFLGRRMGRRWFGQVSGGLGTMVPLRQTFRLTQGLQYTAGGSLAFVTRSHTFLGSVIRTFGDISGIAADASINGTGAWRWAPAWRSWAVYASVSSQLMQLAQRDDLRSWQANAGMTKMLGRHFSTSLEYAYVNARLQAGLIRQSNQQAVRGTLTWIPRGFERRAR